MKINLHSIAFPVTVLGPGHRVALWVAGCSRHCPGCISPEHQDPATGRMVGVDAIVRRLKVISQQLEGITISGGEPFEQADALLALVAMIRMEVPAWNIIVYTGYRLQELRRMTVQAQDLLRMIDVLIDGQYMDGHPSAHPLKGSANQRINCLTENGRILRRRMRTLKAGALNFGLGPEGTQMIIGVPKNKDGYFIKER